MRFLEYVLISLSLAKSQAASQVSYYGETKKTAFFMSKLLLTTQ